MTKGAIVAEVRHRSGSTAYVFRAGRTWSEKLTDAIDDLTAGARMWSIWGKLGWRDYQHQTSRTIFGPLWSVMGLAITVGVLGYVYGALLSYDPRHGYPFIAAGLIAWFFIAGGIGGGPSVFINAAGLLKERPLPISFSVYQYTLRLFIDFCMRFAVFALVALFALFFPGHNLVFLLPGILLYFLNGLWVTLSFGILGARYRDISQIIGPLMLIAFLATPILWPQDMLHSNDLVAKLNPFTHFVDIIREPLLGNAPSGLSFAIVVAITVVGWAAALVLFALKKDQIVFWL
jgi:ABC-type polysaccharide/polyol phosphate export permease